MRELTFFPLLESYPKTSNYGYRTDPITGAQGSFHGGVDYGAPWGVPVIAPWDGLVTTGYESGAGNWLWVDAGSDRFKSFHHDSFAVGSGAWVTAGTTIAYIDSTGSSTGSHAHLELWEGGNRIDPTGFFDRAPLLHHTPGTGDDEMTDDDWNQMRTILSNALASKFATHSTPTALFSEPGGQFTLVLKDGKPHRMGMSSPAEVTLLKRVGFIAPQKPMNPPAASPDAIEVGTLSADEQEILHSYPWV
jgi:murein DD-endopeptidase MepM/ murein hydrolase activator NlpD